MSMEDAFLLQVALKDHSKVRNVLENKDDEAVLSELKLLVSNRAMCRYHTWKDYEKKFLSGVQLHDREHVISILRNTDYAKDYKSAKLHKIVDAYAFQWYSFLQTSGDFIVYPDMFLNELNDVLREVAKQTFLTMDCSRDDYDKSITMLTKIASISSCEARAELDRWMTAKVRRNYAVPSQLKMNHGRLRKKMPDTVCKFCHDPEVMQRDHTGPGVLQPKNPNRKIEGTKPIIMVKDNSEQSTEAARVHNSPQNASATHRQTNTTETKDSSVLPSLPDVLKRMQPSTNILILGESGVGKSSFINSIVNYVQHDSLETALKKGPRITIGTKFTVTDDNYETQEVFVKSDNGMSNEVHEPGKSSTQDPRSYCLELEGRSITLIDTPGMGDDRGIQQDEKNFEKILTVISEYKEIHAICILLKPNNAKRTIAFRFCIDKLLGSIPRTANQNILFCFTNCRSTFYRPGDTLPTLRAHLQDISQPGTASIKLERLLARVAELSPYRPPVKLPPSDIPTTIVWLAKPLAEIVRNIITNIFVLNAWKNKSNKKSPVELISTKFTELSHPQIRCGSSRCAGYEWLPGDSCYLRRTYPKVCFEGVLPKNAQYTAYRNEALNSSALFNVSGRCTGCNCSSEWHLCVGYFFKQSIYKMPVVKEKTYSVITKYTPDPDEMINGYRKFLKVIRAACVRLSSASRYHQSNPSFSFAFQSHFDFVITDEDETIAMRKKYSSTGTTVNYYTSVLKDMVEFLNGFLKHELTGYTGRAETIIEQLKNMGIYGTIINDVLNYEASQCKTKNHYETEYIPIRL